ncbi:hypothetical protein Leryth_014353 [Lithospermum erythrorhizon]|nr:hypothetical protein Leryth_014353 [Lithospermum erythrorhizon]
MEMDSMEKAGEDDQVAEEATNLTNFNGDLHLSEKTAPATSDNQGTSSGWKMVLHEESNQYYYWNIETGETSWEAPNVLDLTTESIYGDKEAIDGRQEDASLTEQIDGLISDGCVDRSTLINGNNSHGSVFEAAHEGSKVNASEEKKEGDDGHQGTLQSSYCSLEAQYNEMPVGGVSSTSLGDTNVGYQNASVGDPVVCGPDMRRLGEYEDGSKLSYHLMGYCESLLEQLRSMNRSKDNFELRCIVEVETRLHDIKSLASHGSSLLPFLVHSEKQLLQLTATIKDKIGKDECVQMNEIDNAHKPDGSDGANLIAGSAMNVLDRATYEGSDVLSSDEGQKKFGAYENGTLATEHDSSASDAEGTSDLDRLATQDGTTSNAILHSGDDADMDVDMEVEDVLPPEMSTSEIHIAPVQSLPSMLSENLEVSTPEQAFSVPPPPDGDWIPPPPPDDEPFPPPPPEEPPESTQPPPPGSEQAHIFSYAEQYNQSYSGADIVYYGQTEFPSSNLYNTYSDAHQAAIPQSSVYYNSGQPAFGAIPVGEPGAYYTLQDAASNPTSAAGLEPSIIGSVSGFTSFCPDSSGSINVHPPASYSLLPF